MSGIDLLSLPPGAPSPLLGNEEVPVYVNDTVQTTTTQNIADLPGPVYTVTSGNIFDVPAGGGTVVVRKAAGSATYINLPISTAGMIYVVKDGKGDAATNPIIINPPSGGSIDGIPDYIINWPWGAIDLQFDGVNWNALSNMSSGGGGGVDTFNTRTGNITLTTADVTGVGGATTAYVTNALGSYLPLAGGAVTGNLAVGGNLTVTGTAFASTPAPGDNTNKVATTAFVEAAVVSSTTGVATFNGRTGSVVLTAGDITGAGGATQAALSNYLPLAGGAIAGPVTAPTPPTTDNSTNIATTAYVRSAASGIAANYLPLAGGTLTGVLNSSPTTGSPIINLNKPASGQYDILRGSTNGSRRWELILGDSTAETGSNNGSNFSLNAFDDTGATALGQYFTVNRANGLFTLSNGGSFGGSVSANGSFTTNGSAAGVQYSPRNGAGNQYVIYNLDGNMLRFWQSNTGDIATFSAGQCFFNEGITVANAPQIHMTPSVGAGGYGAMWHNDGSNTYLLLTNNNDAQGGWNGLRPFMVNDSNGAVSMNQGLTVTNNLTANNINTQYGIVYSGYAGNVVSFRWTGVLQIFIDGNYNGDIATTSTLGNYLPISGGTITGNLQVNGYTTLVGGTTVQGNGIRYTSLANNQVGFKWVGNALQIIVDGTYQGTINISSEERMKIHRAKPEVDSLADILRIGLESFDQVFMPGGPEFHYPIGMIAQNLQQVGADLVYEGVNHDKDGKPTTVTGLSVALLPLLARLVGAVQQLSARVEALEAKAV